MMRRSVACLLLFAPYLLQAADAPATPTAGAQPATAATPAASAARNSYRVEVIVFRQNQSPGGAEDYSAPPEGRGFGDRRDVGGVAPTLVRMLEDSELQLGGIAQKLRSGGAVQVLAHKGWIQSATAWGRHTGLPIETFGIEVPNLRGSFYLERGDLLHFGAYLQYGASPLYVLSELRKVRFNEKHYLDNPAFGVVVQVSPNR
jgi:hypothetical protein